jgi:hypothetical protein
MLFGAFPVLKLLLFCRGDLHREEVKRFNFWNILVVSLFCLHRKEYHLYDRTLDRLLQLLHLDFDFGPHGHIRTKSN